MPDLRSVSTEPVILERLELVTLEGQTYALACSRDGAWGAAPTNQHTKYFAVIFRDRVAADFLDQDARDLPKLVDTAYRSRSSYKYGFAFWNAAAWAEQAVLDLLGRVDGVPVGHYFGQRRRSRLPVYLSSLKRNTSPEEEVAWLERRLAESGATAVKIKIGGRMSRNTDAAPGRTDRLVPLARRTFGEDVAIYVDANGSYDAASAIEVGRMLQDHGVGWFEEPCPFDALDWTKQVADALDMSVAGGEQDHSLHTMRMLAEQRIVDILQPDIAYCGGLLRAWEISRLANAAGLPIAPHAPRTGHGMAATAQLLSVIDLPAAHLEYRADAVASQGAGPLNVQDGAVIVPDGPGLGSAPDDADWRKAEPLM